MTVQHEDTIAAIATARGRSGTALVRISGPAAPAVAATLCGPELPSRSPTLTLVRHPDGTRVDRALVTLFPAPASFTGEDVLEISCHGGALVPALVLDAACAAGARVAESGEFTRRAYLNGKLDLVQVEATLDLIDANSPAHHHAALFQLEGGLSRRIDALRTGLLELRATLAYEIDFPEEDDGPISRERTLAKAADLRTQIVALLRHAPEGERLREGVLTVLAGAPNSGKSSIFNSLLGSQRAIVTETPGTTRDAIEATTSIDGYPFRLVDTAGVRADAGHVERLGMEVARRYLAHADIVLLCIEAGRRWREEEATLEREATRSGATVVAVRTKSDLMRSGSGEPGKVGSESGCATCTVSAHSGAGMPELRDTLAGLSFGGLRDSAEPALVTRARHARALERAAAEIAAFGRVFGAGQPAEIAETHLVDATLALEEIVGVTDVEDVLGTIFASFCVGK